MVITDFSRRAEADKGRTRPSIHSHSVTKLAGFQTVPDDRGFLDAGLRTVSGLVARVSGKVDIPGRTKGAADGPHHRLLPGLLARPEPPAPARRPAHPWL